MSKPTRIAICLLRNDLRYIDNEVLHWCNKSADYVLPVYCFDPRHYVGTHTFGLQKTGPHRFKFLLESVVDLRNVLKSRGSSLIVRKGKPEVVLPEIIQSLGIDNVSSVAFQEEVTKEELDVERGIRVNCKGIDVHTFWGSTLIHKDDVPFAIPRTPNVFTEFRKQVENQSKVRREVIMPDRLKPLPPGISEGDLPTYSDYDLTEPSKDARSAFPFPGGETSGLNRINYYFWETDNVARYKETRNGMIGHDYSTKFAAWLAHGCLSPRHIYWQIKKYEEARTSNTSTYWVIFELFWRDYFKFVGLKFGDKLFYKSGLMGKHVPWKVDKKLFEAWRDGRTGVPFVDANMRELKETGFMSNRGRQNVASFLTKDLHLDWRLGAEWFESMLVDHDVCSNYGNWLYSAGLGNDPRQDRKFNMVKQGLDYDPQGEYIHLWVPELKEVKGGGVHTVWNQGSGILERAGVTLGETYPMPIVVAPEWSRHFGKATKGNPRKGSAGPPRGGQRGMDFYFKGQGSRR